MKEMKLFPEGLEEALANLLKVLAASPHSFRIRVHRYEPKESYTAHVEIAHLTDEASVTVAAP